jgi:hypothetical protein
MPQYRLNGLGDQEFERMIQALLKEIIGSGTITFGAGPDGGREATHSGRAPYPSSTEQWSGEWIFQAKFHDTDLIGQTKARAAVVKDADGELDKIVNKYKRRCDNYILATNVSLSSVSGSGTHDTIERTVFSKYRGKVKNLAIWGGDEDSRFLEKYSSIRTAYLHFIVPGDLLAQLLESDRRALDETAMTMRLYLQASFGREQNAQLDQAGDVSDDPVRLQEVFFDLDARIPYIHRKLQLKAEAVANLSMEQRKDGSRVAMARLLLSDQLDRIVLVGGPGEGKSTVAQYLAQLHRANLLGRISEVAIDGTYVPVLPRLPLRVTLRDFGQWLAERREKANGESDTLDAYLTEHIQKVSSRQITTHELHRSVRENPVLLILDGLDEVTDQSLKKVLLERLSEFVSRCESVLKADLQVLATTRPTGYSDQFDPERYLHLRLLPLEPDQVRMYVSRWTLARDLDEPKSIRLRDGIDECLADPQIKLLTNTPLQVTILVLIISSGGSPPRQREALFDEYLEVIYKRETAKGRDIIQSEKELLIGLHKFVGYILHEEATRGAATSAALPRVQYERRVEAFLRWHDPYSAEKVRERELRAITRETGERLVLLVESPVDIFGFELRSIQEFFAACHLTDTSLDT